MIKFTYRVTATVTKDIEVLVENAGMTHEEAEELGKEYAHENFTSECDGDEKYSETSELVSYTNQ